MKKLLALIPCVILAACGGAADITGDEPFQITCTWTRGDKSGDETWFIGPKLDVATNKWEDDEEVNETEYVVRKVTPTKIVLGDEWGQIVNEDGSYGDWTRDEISVDRSTGEFMFKKFGLSKSSTRYPTLAQGYLGKETPLEFEYSCKKPTR